MITTKGVNGNCLDVILMQKNILEEPVGSEDSWWDISDQIVAKEGEFKVLTIHQSLFSQNLNTRELENKIEDVWEGLTENPRNITRYLAHGIDKGDISVCHASNMLSRDGCEIVRT